MQRVHSLWETGVKAPRREEWFSEWVGEVRKHAGLRTLTVEIILQHMYLSTHYGVHFKLMQCYISTLNKTKGGKEALCRRVTFSGLRRKYMIYGYVYGHKRAIWAEEICSSQDYRSYIIYNRWEDQMGWLQWNHFPKLNVTIAINISWEGKMDPLPSQAS